MTRKLLMAIVVLLGSACATATEEIALSECGTSARLHPGDTLVVRLPSQATAGYLWHLASQAAGILQPKGESSIEWASNQPDRDGGSEIQIFRFQAMAVGQERLTFHETHPWAMEDPPLRTCTLDIEVAPTEP